MAVHSSSQYTLGSIFFHYIKSYEMPPHLSVFNSSVGRVEDHQSDDGGSELYQGRVFVFLIFSNLARRHELLLAFLQQNQTFFPPYSQVKKICKELQGKFAGNNQEFIYHLIKHVFLGECYQINSKKTKCNGKFCHFGYRNPHSNLWLSLYKLDERTDCKPCFQAALA